jgi:very-short-patch-repair endonuclease/DNA polymerase III delta prime subunit
LDTSHKSTLLETRIEKWKRDLIDLTNRNVLLNFKPKRTNSVQFYESPQELFDLLAKESSHFIVEDLNTSVTKVIEKIRLSEEEDFIKKKKIEEEKERFNKILSKLRLDARTRLNEQGIHTLYLVFGVLKWKEQTNDKEFLAPLLLVPVELNRSSANQPFKIRMVDDEMVLNPFLAHKLKEEKGIFLAELEDREEIDLGQLWDEIFKQINYLEGWEVLSEIYLSLFSFSKLVMYKDLEHYRDLLEAHPLILEISGESNDEGSNYLMDLSGVPDESTLDKTVPSQESFQVLDADYSQHQAIIAAKKGVSFVLQGPPGTGKSQTISNIIAECLAMNKKVLFVSEKMAALEVVKSRLEQVGFGDFCLELHSHKSNKRALLDSFNDAINKDLERKQINTELYSEIDALREQFNTYVEEIHKVRQPLGQSVYEIHGLLAKLDNIPELLFDIGIEDNRNIGNISNLLKELERFRNHILQTEGPPIWQGFTLSSYSLELASNIEALLQKYIKNVINLQQAAQLLEERYGLIYSSIEDYRKNQMILESAKYSPKPPRNWFSHSSIQSTIAQAKEYQEQMSNFLGDRQQLSHIFKEGILDLSLREIISNLFVKSRELFMVFGAKDPIVLINEGPTIKEEIQKGFLSLSELDNLLSIQNEYGLPQEETMGGMKQVLNLMSVLSKKPRPTHLWFQDIRHVKSNIHEAKQLFVEWKQKKTSLQTRYNLSVLELDLLPKRQKLDSLGAEILEKFRPADNMKSADTSIFSKRYSILEKLEKLKTYCMQYEQSKATVSSIIDIDISNLKAVRKLKPLIERISKNPRPQSSWFNMERHHEIYTLIQDSKGIFTKYQQELATTLEVYEEEIIDEKIIDIFDRFENRYQTPWRVLIGTYRRDRKWLKSKFKKKEKIDFDTQFKHVRSVKRVIEHQKWVNSKQNELRSMFGWHYKELETDWQSLDDSFATVREIIDLVSGTTISIPLRELLINPTVQLGEFSSEYERLVTISDQMEELLNSLKHEFPSLFKMWEAIPIEQWKLQDVFKYLVEIQTKLNSLYSDVDTILENRIVGTLSHVSLQELLEDIDLGLTIIRLENSISTNESLYIEFMGSWYLKEQTSWDRVEQALSNIESLLEVTNSIPEVFQTLLIEGADVPNDRMICLEQAILRLEDTLSYLIYQIPMLFDDFGHKLINHWEISKIKERLQWLEEKSLQWNDDYAPLTSIVSKEYSSIVDLKKDMEHAVTVQQQKSELDERLQFLKETFGDYFSGYSTNWELIFDALSWLEEWLEFFNEEKVPDKLINLISEGSDINTKQEFSTALETGTTLLKENTMLYKELLNYFTQETLQIDEHTFEYAPFNLYLTWLEKRFNSMEFLEEWVRFKRLETRLREEGLLSFLELLQKEEPSQGTFLELFLKRYYRKWLDQIYQEVAILYDFEAEKFNEAIDTFRVQDTKSLHINTKRLQKILVGNSKHAIESLTYRKELNVLLHEIGKKKRHIAIRKLLSQISNLAQEIKPCFLMSPLSVSQFLDARNISFDVVIFDEASQIFPEDAIGSIIRGSQVIIVGDNKQLPPTDFFKSGGIGEEFEDEEDIEYESILDECMYVLPNMRLRWHYRSRHESLISFSNQAFYQNSLITFPSAEHGEELGVKFVHVSNGTYDRGGTRSNRKEAEVTAKLVFEHFQKNPRRSLGVIAFSDAQASEIREQIDTLRKQNSDMETFFEEGHPDEFFVKSLENVQGDERDVIFFSVGYGKAPDGSLHMNFGPLSKNGGERRLNVAVTRAKYHVKLISSLLPQDIPLERTNSVGVHRLRDYMQMAIGGILPTYSSEESKQVFDSPFEEDVYEVLVDMGYEVHTQVGCSGYKIDLAVVDPLQPDRYLLGIECDGKTYHSSKVARDRDRLRQQVLENLGWKIHRIWSQEWFKKRKLEVTKLKNLLNKLRYE